jgi:hypothetical protein
LNFAWQATKQKKIAGQAAQHQAKQPSQAKITNLANKIENFSIISN